MVARNDGQILTRVIQGLDLPEPAVAADLGCGDGQRGARIMAELGCTVYACELDPAKAELASSFAKVDVCDVRDWLPPEPLDLILCAELLEHLPAGDQPAFLRKLRTSLSEGGRLILSTPQRHSPVALAERAYARLRRRPAYDWWDPTHLSVLSRRDLEAMVAASGFAVDRRIGVHLVPHLVPVRALHQTVHEGRLGTLGFDLIYVLR